MEFLKSKLKRSCVSICIPAFNCAQYIERTIRSVLNSTYSKLELIISDDGSTDGTIDIVKGIKDKRIRVIENSYHLGVPNNWNRTLRYASGEFIGLLNHDDIYGQFWLTFAVNVLKKHPNIGWVATAFYIINENDEAISFVSRFPETRQYSIKEAFLCVAKLNGLGPGYIVRRQVLENIGCYDKDAGPSADNDLFLRISSKYPLYYSNKPHTCWRKHKNNLTHKWRPVDQAVYGFKKLNKIFSYSNLPLELKKYKDYCLKNFYSKVKVHAEELKKKGDIESYHRLNQILRLNENRFAKRDT